MKTRTYKTFLTIGMVVVAGPSWISSAGAVCLGQQESTSGCRLNGVPGPCIGTSGDDYIESITTAAKVMNGKEGNDLIIGSSNADKVCGGSGTDIIIAGAGNDVIDAGSGNDIVYPGLGNDSVEGGPGNDTINDMFKDPGSGPSFVTNCPFGGVIVQGTNVNDVLCGGNGNDTIYGGNGTDNIFGSNGNDTLRGGDGVDYLYGQVGADTVDGDEPGNQDGVNSDNDNDTCSGETRIDCGPGSL